MHPQKASIIYIGQSEERTQPIYQPVPNLIIKPADFAKGYLNSIFIEALFLGYGDGNIHTKIFIDYCDTMKAKSIDVHGSKAYGKEMCPCSTP